MPSAGLRAFRSISLDASRLSLHNPSLAADDHPRVFFTWMVSGTLALGVTMRIRVVVVLLAAFSSVSTFAQTTPFEPIKGVLNDSHVRVRQSPNLQAQVLETLRKGYNVEVLERSGARMKIGQTEDYWYKIRTAAGVEGWAYGAYLDLSSDQTAPDLQQFMDNPYEDMQAPLPPDSMASLGLLYSKMGHPQNVQEEIAETRNAGPDEKGDKWVSFTYDDVWLRYYYSIRRKVYLLAVFQVIKPRYQLQYGIKIGMTEVDLLRTFQDTPSKVDQEQDQYGLLYPAPQSEGSISFRIEKGALVAITIFSGDF